MAPSFWRREGWLPALLAPASRITRALTARRVGRPGWRAPVPVLCCGNVTVGGSGKTTVVLDLAERLRSRGVDAHVMLRGHGGRTRVSRRVRPDDTAATVGDEALLLAAVAPTWVGANRAASARLAIAAGAQFLLLDDGLQNPTLEKTASLLVIDGASGLGNGRLLPAGPLRETLETAVARVRAAVLIGDDETGIEPRLPVPVLRARLRPDAGMLAMAGRRVFAFAGIAHPGKFFRSLADAGAIVCATKAFADHQTYTPKHVWQISAMAYSYGAIPVTTPKDAARLSEPQRRAVRVAGVTLAWDDPDALEALLSEVTGLERSRPAASDVTPA